MRFFDFLRVASLFILTQVHAVQAITIIGNVQPSSNIDLTETVERGGTVSAIDMEKRIIVVDGITFPLTRATLKIHGPTGTLFDKISQLKPGMQIRFNTSGHNYSAQMQVYEIWVVSVGSNKSGN